MYVPFFWLCGVFIAVLGLSLVAASGATLLLDFSLRWLVPCIGRQILNHWTTSAYIAPVDVHMDVSPCMFLKKIFFFFFFFSFFLKSTAIPEHWGNQFHDPHGHQNPKGAEVPCIGWHRICIYPI